MYLDIQIKLLHEVDPAIRRQLMDQEMSLRDEL